MEVVHEQRWELAADAAEIPRIRHAVRQFVTDTETLPSPRLQELELAVTEIVTNALVHGYRDGAEGDIVVDVVVNGRVEVIVRDDGVGMRSNPASPGLGLGLGLVGRLADALDIRAAAERGTEVRMVFER